MAPSPPPPADARHPPPASGGTGSTFVSPILPLAGPSLSDPPPPGGGGSPTGLTEGEVGDHAGWDVPPLRHLPRDLPLAGEDDKGRYAIGEGGAAGAALALAGPASGTEADTKRAGPLLATRPFRYPFTPAKAECPSRPKYRPRRARFSAFSGTTMRLSASARATAPSDPPCRPRAARRTPGCCRAGSGPCASRPRPTPRTGPPSARRSR